jgi:hypothetical protein
VLAILLIISYKDNNLILLDGYTGDTFYRPAY